MIREKSGKAIGVVVPSILLLIGTFFGGTATAQDSEEIGFEEVEEPARSSTGDWTDVIHISGRFDLNLEMFNFGDGEDTDHFRNYHRFIFVKATPSNNLSLSAEIVDQYYYEISYRLGSKMTIKAGKIWVPFGLTPFHHYYGGVQGDPFTGLLVPNVWAELGVGLDYPIADNPQRDWKLSGDSYVIRGFDGTPGSVLNLSEGGKDDVFAFGQRLTLRALTSKIVVAGSALYNEWGPSNDEKVLLWGTDLELNYGLFTAPILSDLAFRGAFARAEVKDPTLVDGRFDEEGWYFKYGDFAELSYGRFRPSLTIKARFGSYIDFDDIVTNNDTHSFSLAAVRHAGPLTLVAHYFWVFEEADEVNNDFLRLQMILDF